MSDMEARSNYDRNEQRPDILRPYASNFLYNAAGAVTAMRLGNGRWENTVIEQYQRSSI
ncbi:MAG: hypothetical protein JNJ39_13825 [Blastocatellia bacterium]|nr:hypothetical protein [Blastocatellia bacterium]